ncbi:MAG: hypothetical protein APF80_01930 [Alphaproteobacteria bacterium BRH_c36]|nr:MAG: hypothetical protein APF80_01930 [Alphaproteobacteria bacterium BRH_c36]
MVSGRKTLAEIERSIEELRIREQQLLKDVEGLTAHHVRLLEERTAAIRELAEVRTRGAVADGVIDEADALEHQVASLLLARQTTIDALKARAADANTKRKAFNVEAEAVRTEIAALEKQLDEAAAKARDQLAAEPAYAELAKARDQLAKVHKQAEEKTRQAEEDRLHKGQAYENDPLFMYLWRRKYGSADYRPHWLIRMGDDRVARLVGYSEARGNYAILNEIPNRLREHVALLAADMAAAVASIQKAEAERINEIAGNDLTGSLAAARGRQVDTNKALETSEAEIAEISRQLNQYAEGLDQSFKEAIALSAKFLEQESYQRLIMLARRTAEPTDDSIVARIGEMERKATDVKRTIDERRKDLDKVSAKRKELLDIAAKFRRNHYDDDASEFELDDIAEDILEALIKGVITGADYWARSQRRQKWRGRPADPFRKSAGLPPFGGGWSGGRSKGSGGGFKTGGGF